MSKALVLKQADFSANKLTTVQLIQDIPCTGIALNKSSASIADTETLIATVTPSNTTEPIMWSSSNNNVATVNGGVVTAVANGTATITATCGLHSASCAVNVAIPFIITKQGMIMVDVVNGARLDRATVNNALTRFASLGAEDGTYIAAWEPSLADSDFEELYPYPIPAGATSINVAMSDNIACLVVFYNSNEHAAVPSGYLNTALVLDGETSASGTPWSIPSWTYGNRSISIPSASGIDSFTLGFYFKTQSDYDNFDPTNPGITITFGFGTL